jgi:acetylornithine/N-succinyldiaminopimelate aminotransferase
MKENPSTSEIEEKDKKFLGRDADPRPVEVATSEGDFLIGTDGKKYIDFSTGWCVGNVGWGNEEIREAIQQFESPDYVSPAYVYKGWGELAELLADITPNGLVKSFRATGGTEAVEIAMQAAMKHTGRHEFVSVEGAYHGHSIGTMSIGMSGFRDWYQNLLPGCHKIKAPLGEQAIKEVEKLLKTRKVAAFISEPIICNLGVEIPADDFLPAVQELCKKYETVFIMDEVATGFGRTGKMFASEHYNLQPDILCLAKGISGGYGAIGATVMTKELAKTMEFGFSFYSTYGWHPLNVVAAIASITYLKNNEEKIFKNAQHISKYFEERLTKMKFRSPVEVRIKGLAIGLKFADEKYAAQILEKAIQKRLLLADATVDTVVMFPALTMSQDTAQKGLDILEAIL